MNKKIIAIVVIIAAAVGLCYWLCAEGKLPRAAGDTIRIGFLGTLTGHDATSGTTELNMAKLVVEDANKAGGVLGKQIEFVVYDTKANEKDSVDAVKRMIEKDHVCAIIGSDTSEINIATAPVVNAAKVPQISTLGTSPLVTVDEKGNVRPYSFRMCFTDPYQGALSAEFVFAKLRLGTAAVLYNTDSTYARGLREFFVRSYTGYGGRLVADEVYHSKDTDFQVQLTKIKKSGAKALFLPGLGKDMALIIKQARKLGLTATIVGGDGYGQFMNKIAGQAMEGTYWIEHTYLGDPNMKPVFERYKKVYNEDCEEFANGAMAYDATLWLLDSIKRAKTTDGTAIAKELESTNELKLTHAVLSIDPETHDLLNKAAIFLKVDKNLKAQFYDKVEPR